MQSSSPYRLAFVRLSLALCLAWLLNISSGSVSIPLTATLSSLLGQPIHVASWHYILWEYRIPKALTAVLAGGGLALSGLLMQTLFRNPLAGPYVLGISSGASLGVALLLMGSSVLSGFVSFVFVTDILLAVAASAGSFLVLFVVVVAAQRVKDTLALLIIGLMFGSVTAALVSLLAYFSPAEQLQQFLFWSLGSLANLSLPQTCLLGAMVALGIGLSLCAIKALNALLLGEHYAQSLGVSLKKSRLLLILAAGVLAGSITAFVGPIAFVGLAVPHLTRQIFNTMEHRILIPGVLLYGAIVLLLCDALAQWPNAAQVLPLNAITSLLGAPVVIWLLLRKRKMLF